MAEQLCGKYSQQSQWDNVDDTNVIYRYKTMTYDIAKMSSTVALFKLLQKFDIIKGYQSYPVPGEPVIDITYWF